MISRSIPFLARTFVIFSGLATMVYPSDRCCGQQKAPQTDRNGDVLPDGAVARIGTLRFRVSGRAYSLAYSPSGRYLAVGGASMKDIRAGSQLAIFDSRSGNAVHRLTGHTHVVRAVAFSDDDKLFASGGGDSKMVVWNMENGWRIWSSETNVGSDTIAFLGHSKTLAADENGKNIRLFDATTGKAGILLTGHESRIFRIAGAPDGKTLASCSMDGTVRLWDVASGKEVSQFPIDEKYGLDVSFSRDGKLLACGTFTGAIYLWDLTSGRERWRTPSRQDAMSSVAFSPDGSELYTVRKEICVLDTANGKQKRSFPLPREMHHLAVTSDGKRAAAIGDEPVVRLFDLSDGTPLNPNAGHAEPIFGVAFAPDGKSLATASRESVFRLWDASTGRRLKEFQGKAGSVAFSADGKTLATTAEFDSVSLWNVATDKRKQLEGAPMPTNGRIAFLQGQPPLLVCDVNGTLTVWDATNGKLMPQNYTKGPDPLSSSVTHDLPFAVAGDGRTIAIDNKKRYGPIVLWDARSGKELRATEVDASVLAISPDSRLLAALRTGAFLPGETGPRLVLIDALTGKEKHKLPHTKYDLDAVFSPDGRMLAAADSSGVRLWETASGQERRHFAGHEGPIRCVAFSPDGLKLASGSDDTTALIWDVYRERTETALVADEPGALWAMLADDKADRAFDAIRQLLRRPQQAVALARKHLKATDIVNSDQLQHLFDELDSDKFAVRKNAQSELQRIGLGAIAALEKAATDKNATPEFQRGIQIVLDRLHSWDQSSEGLRVLRLVEVLEHVSSSDAHDFLRDLARGAHGSPQTQAAQLALKRLLKE